MARNLAEALQSKMMEREGALKAGQETQKRFFEEQLEALRKEMAVKQMLADSWERDVKDLHSKLDKVCSSSTKGRRGRCDDTTAHAGHAGPDSEGRRCSARPSQGT